MKTLFNLTIITLTICSLNAFPWSLYLQNNTDFNTITTKICNQSEKPTDTQWKDFIKCWSQNGTNGPKIHPSFDVRIRV